MINILIVEDDVDINDMIKEALTKENYHCTQAFSGTEAVMHVEKEDYFLIILDLMLPGLSGEEFIDQFAAVQDTPILVISAKDSIDSKIESLRLGADDYLVKPFDIKELKARVAALIRRSKKNIKSENLNHKGIVLNNHLFNVSFKGESLGLTKQEYKIMKLLMENPNQVFTKQAIYEYAWDSYYMGDEKTINVHISNIRKKIRPVLDDDLIETVWGIGFKLKK